MRLWRIATVTRTYLPEDLSGAGAAASPGRWNDAGEHVVYAAQAASLAVLGTAAHIDPAGLPLNRFLVAIEVPGAVWAAARRLDIKTLDPGWSAVPAGIVSVRAGSVWLRSRRSAILLVPSVIVPEEWAALINPGHPDAAGITAKAVRKFEYDHLFRRP